MVMQRREEMKIHHVLLLGLAIAATVSGALSGFAQNKSSEPIKVFIFTGANDGGFVDPDQRQRSDSVEDVKKALDKKNLIEIVGQREGADLTLEVLGRGGEETGTVTTRPGPFGTWNSSNDTVATVRVGLTAGTYTSLIEGYGGKGQIFSVWHTAANNAAKKIESWIKANHDNLIARRAQH
jgi:hypothetical protein